MPSSRGDSRKRGNRRVHREDNSGVNQRLEFARHRDPEREGRQPHDMRLVLLAIALIVLAVAPARAGFEEGFAAYQRGDRRWPPRRRSARPDHLGLHEGPGGAAEPDPGELPLLGARKKASLTGSATAKHIAARRFILRDDEANDQDLGRNKHEQGANSARHGLLRGAGADELAHRNDRLWPATAGIACTFSRPRSQVHTAAIEVLGKGSARRSRRALKASLATPDNSRVRLLVTARRAVIISGAEARKTLLLGLESGSSRGFAAYQRGDYITAAEHYKMRRRAPRRSARPDRQVLSRGCLEPWLPLHEGPGGAAVIVLASAIQFRGSISTGRLHAPPVVALHWPPRKASRDQLRPSSPP